MADNIALAAWRQVQVWEKRYILSQHSVDLRILADERWQTWVQSRLVALNNWPLARKQLRLQSGGGFFLACEDFGRMFDNSFPACASIFFFFLFKWRLARANQLHPSGQDLFTVVQRAETTVTECFMTCCVWVRFLTDSHTLLDSGIVSLLRLRWVRGICEFRYNLPSALLAEWPGSFTCPCGNTGVKRTPNKSQHTNLTLEKKILPPLPLGLELATFRY